MDKFVSDRSVHGDVTVLRLEGTLGSTFEGKKLAEQVKTRKLVVVMEAVRRIASWGMAEWMEFLRILSECDIYLVECSTYAVSQLNIVTGLLGHAKLVSFYASYRCSSCSASSNSLFLIPRDRDIIRGLQGSEYQCKACGGSQKLEEYPAAFFDTIANREPFDIDDEVLALLRAKFSYDIAPDVKRFRAVGAEADGRAYMRLSGMLSQLPADKLRAALQPTTVVDLAGALLDDAGVREWRAFQTAALSTVKSLQLAACPPGFLESAITSDDLRDKLKVRSFAAAYACTRCQKQFPQLVDVADHLEDLVTGKVPEGRCPQCKSPAIAMVDPELRARLSALPARGREPELEKLVTKARGEPPDKLANLLVVQPRKPAPAAPRRGGLYAILGAIVVLLGGVAYFAIDTWRTQREQKQQVVTPVTSDAPAKPKFVRPEWIVADSPASAYCHDIINRLICVGVSSYSTNRDDALVEANNAALEELVHTVGLKIGDPFFKGTATRVGEVRSKQLAALHAAEADRESTQYKAAIATIRTAREQVATALRLSGGPAVPAQRSDWYWEEYAGDGGPNEQLVFVRYDINLDVVRSLIEHYSRPVTVDGSSLVTVFPGVAWLANDLARGVLVMTPGRKLARAGVKPEDHIVSVNAEPVTDAGDLARKLEAAAKTDQRVQLSVRSGAEAPREVSLRL